jgi:hypothetical protein
MVPEADVVEGTRLHVIAGAFDDDETEEAEEAEEEDEDAKVEGDEDSFAACAVPCFFCLVFSGATKCFKRSKRPQ